ncbi:TPA: hypothetical protein JD342_22210 [Citrobacter freundii]|nr:hypothetical protein [Citrobacter freundii]
MTVRNQIFSIIIPTAFTSSASGESSFLQDGTCRKNTKKTAKLQKYSLSMFFKPYRRTAAGRLTDD